MSEAVWAELARDSEGYAQLERGRDAAFAVIQAICSVSDLIPLQISLIDLVLSA